MSDIFDFFERAGFQEKRDKTMAKRPEMTRDQVFDWLAGQGVARVDVEFSGGGDEGGVDDIYFLNKLGNHLEDLEAPDGVTSVLENSVDDGMSSGWENGSGTQGTCTWDVAARTVKINGQYEEWVDFDEITVEEPPEGDDDAQG